MKSSIRNGAFLKWLVKAVPVVSSVEVAGSGGDVRFTSFCRRQVYGAPCWFTWSVFERGASDTPRTRSQRPPAPAGR